MDDGFLEIGKQFVSKLATDDLRRERADRSANSLKLKEPEELQKMLGLASKDNSDIARHCPSFTLKRLKYLQQRS